MLNGVSKPPLLLETKPQGSAYFIDQQFFRCSVQAPFHSFPRCLLRVSHHRNLLISNFRVVPTRKLDLSKTCTNSPRKIPRKALTRNRRYGSLCKGGKPDIGHSRRESVILVYRLLWEFVGYRFPLVPRFSTKGRESGEPTSTWPPHHGRDPTQFVGHPPGHQHLANSTTGGTRLEADPNFFSRLPDFYSRSRSGGRLLYSLMG